MAASAEFEFITDSPIPGWVMRVRIRGVAVEQRAAPIVGAVGDVPIVALSPTTEDEIQGFLEQEPDAGASVRLGYLGDELVDIGVTYQPPQV